MPHGHALLLGHTLGATPVPGPASLATQQTQTLVDPPFPVTRGTAGKSLQEDVSQCAPQTPGQRMVPPGPAVSAPHGEPPAEAHATQERQFPPISIPALPSTITPSVTTATGSSRKSAHHTAVGQVGQVEALPGTAPYHLREQPAMLNALHILAILAFTSAPAQRLPLLPGPRPLAPR